MRNGMRNGKYTGGATCVRVTSVCVGARCVPVCVCEWGCAAVVATGTAYGRYEDGLRGITSLINTH